MTKDPQSPIPDMADTIAEDLEEVRKHPMYKLFDGFIVDHDLRNYNVRTFQKSSEQAKALLLMRILEFIKENPICIQKEKTIAQSTHQDIEAVSSV